MCGFAGILGATREASAARIPEKMAEMVAYRGPDDAQSHIDAEFHVAFRRLSIVDLAGGQQPFVAGDGVSLVLNGEIYNHRELRSLLKNPAELRSQSDAEVVLHLYRQMGSKAFDLLNGMFALAIWEPKTKRLTLARDRLGIKPLYVLQSKDEVAFASELKCFLPYPRCNRAIDWPQALIMRDATFLAVEESWLPTHMQGVQMLAGGCYAQFELRPSLAAKTTRFWSRPPMRSSASVDGLLEEYWEILTTSVAMRLMADVQLGAFLSGGLDSAAIVQIAAQQDPKIPTFSVLSQSTLGNGDARGAHENAKRLGIKNHQVLFPSSLQSHGWEPKHWNNLLWLLETPFCEAEHWYKWQLHQFAKEHYPELKVILLGQGSDEFNGGYSTTWSNGKTRAANWEQFGVLIDEFSSENFCKYDGTIPTGYDGELIIRREFIDAQRGTQRRAPAEIYWDQNLRRLQYYNLWHEDRTSMGNSIEARVPFLDHRLVELTCSIPEALHPQLLWNKNILRMAAKRFAPELNSEAPKVPFFLGRDRRFTTRLIFSHFTQNNFGWIEEMVPPDHPIVSRTELLATLGRMSRDPQLRGFTALLPVLNILGLETMWAKSAEPTQHDAPALREELVIADWDASHDEIAKALFLEETSVHEQSRLCLAPGIELFSRARIENNDDLFITRNDHVEFVIERGSSAAWAKVLPFLKEEKPISEACQLAGVPFHSIRKDIAEALRHRIISIC